MKNIRELTNSVTALFCCLSEVGAVVDIDRILLIYFLLVFHEKNSENDLKLFNVVKINASEDEHKKKLLQQPEDQPEPPKLCEFNYTISLLPNDSENPVPVLAAAARLSRTLSAYVEAFGNEGPIPVQMSSKVINKVVEYLEHTYFFPPPPYVRGDLKPTLWEDSFLATDQATLFEIILASNYLDFPRLTDVSCKMVAEMIRGKTPEQIRKTFNIKNDFTPEEEEQVRRENEWTEEER